MEGDIAHSAKTNPVIPVLLNLVQHLNKAIYS